MSRSNINRGRAMQDSPSPRTRLPPSISSTPGQATPQPFVHRKPSEAESNKSSISRRSTNSVRFHIPFAESESEPEDYFTHAERMPEPHARTPSSPTGAASDDRAQYPESGFLDYDVEAGESSACAAAAMPSIDMDGQPFALHAQPSSDRAGLRGEIIAYRRTEAGLVFTGIVAFAILFWWLFGQASHEGGGDQPYWEETRRS